MPILSLHDMENFKLQAGENILYNKIHLFTVYRQLLKKDADTTLRSLCKCQAGPVLWNEANTAQ